MELALIIVWLISFAAFALLALSVLRHLDNISKQTTEMNAYIKVLVEESDRSPD